MTVLIPRDKRRSRFLFDWTAQTALERGSLDARTGQAATFGRGSLGSVIGSDGSLRYAGSVEPRFHWGPDGGVGLLLENASTNAFTHSQDFTNAAWTKNNVTVTAAAGIAPDGTLTAQSVVPTASSSNAGVERIGMAGTASRLQTFSIFAKAREWGYLELRTGSLAGNAGFSRVNLMTQAVAILDPLHTVTVERYAAGWARYTVIFDAQAGGGSLVAFVLPESGASGGATGDGTSGVLLWGAQFESDRGPGSSYIPTTTAAVTRSADTLAFACNLLPRALTLYVEALALDAVPPGGLFVWADLGHYNGTSRENLMIDSQGGAAQAYHFSVPTATQVGSSSAIEQTFGQTIEWRLIATDTGSVQLGGSVNGGAETLDTASGAAAFGPTFGEATLLLNESGGNGESAYRRVRIAAGNQPLSYMRAG